MRADTAKAAMWGALSTIALIALGGFPSALLPPFFFLVVAIGYGFMLPVLAVLHARHQRYRESGAILGTISGTSVVVLGMIASADPTIAVGALFVRGIWWWTIGKMWWETDLLPRTFGIVTMMLAVMAFVACLVPTFTGPTLDLALGLWMLALSAALWRSR